eukprot:SAG31_NODE_96_length_25743_cov_56.175948_8_plen_151_part_00
MRLNGSARHHDRARRALTDGGARRRRGAAERKLGRDRLRPDLQRLCAGAALDARRRRRRRRGALALLRAGIRQGEPDPHRSDFEISLSMYLSRYISKHLSKEPRRLSAAQQPRHPIVVRSACLCGLHMRVPNIIRLILALIIYYQYNFTL